MVVSRRAAETRHLLDTPQRSEQEVVMAASERSAKFSTLIQIHDPIATTYYRRRDM